MEIRALVGCLETWTNTVRPQGLLSLGTKKVCQNAVTDGKGDSFLSARSWICWNITVVSSDRLRGAVFKCK
jgi:hypothetical protein